MDDKASNDLWKLLQEFTLSERKRNLFIVNCLNHIKSQFANKDLKVLDILNLYAQGKITKNEAKQASKRKSLDSTIAYGFEILNHKMSRTVAFLVCNHICQRNSKINSPWTHYIQDKYNQEMRWQWDLLKHMTNSKMRPTYD